MKTYNLYEGDRLIAEKQPISTIMLKMPAGVRLRGPSLGEAYKDYNTARYTGQGSKEFLVVERKEHQVFAGNDRA